MTTRLFDLPFEFVVPDILYKEEFLDWIGPDLVALGLRIVELEPHEVERAALLRRNRAVLSIPDVCAFSLAAERGWTLLTGDGALRMEAQSQRVEMYGVLWVFDQLQNSGACPVEDLRDGLTALRDHPRCRLPVREINRRLRLY
ncbi:hypothetical protein [uncultured Roseobacter sp.]|uniref:hypothetical protein n=1 Tax=uncultured Roseobacter sp. TaxID=114847 RepID=UPI00261CF2BA|nr:hypothetical protein [uncultured Roseobacter sp.]